MNRFYGVLYFTVSPPFKSTLCIAVHTAHVHTQLPKVAGAYAGLAPTPHRYLPEHSKLRIRLDLDALRTRINRKAHDAHSQPLLQHQQHLLRQRSRRRHQQRSSSTSLSRATTSSLSIFTRSSSRMKNGIAQCGQGGCRGCKAQRTKSQDEQMSVLIMRAAGLT
jgi:hypothetical protein